jgi:hypothetical protein
LRQSLSSQVLGTATCFVEIKGASYGHQSLRGILAHPVVFGTFCIAANGMSVLYETMTAVGECTDVQPRKILSSSVSLCAFGMQGGPFHIFACIMHMIGFERLLRSFYSWLFSPMLLAGLIRLFHPTVESILIFSQEASSKGQFRT